MDMRMPVMNGIEATKIIKNEFPDGNIKVVAITASVFKHQVENLEEVGCDDFIFKPVKIDLLFECISKHLEVEFEYEVDETSKEELSVDVELDFSQLKLPKDLYIQLKKGAESYNLTESLLAIAEIEKLDGDNRLLGKLLRKSAERFNLEKINEIVKKINPK